MIKYKELKLNGKENLNRNSPLYKWSAIILFVLAILFIAIPAIAILLFAIGYIIHKFYKSKKKQQDYYLEVFECLKENIDLYENKTDIQKEYKIIKSEDAVAPYWQAALFQAYLKSYMIKADSFIIRENYGSRKQNYNNSKKYHSNKSIIIIDIIKYI
ncbi:MAG: hypothetical protein KAQ94_02780 [Arcobacteraceae bacterium]|nr:hypothetical protein [Arcobacteraceae bacterium]